MKKILSFLALAGVFTLSGCISSSKTEYIDEDKVSAAFESPKAEADFVAGLAGRKNVPSRFERPEEKSSVWLVVVSVSRKKITSGPNRDYNQYIRFCDTDKNGIISEKEAQVFLASAPPAPSRTATESTVETPARVN